MYPPGSVVQLVPTEAMVKREPGFSPATGDWEFFELEVSASGSKIRTRGFADVNNRFGKNCFACHVPAREPWDFIYFMRLEDSSFAALKSVSAECKKLNKPIFAYFLVGTSKNVETVKMIGWPTAATMETVEEKAAKLNGLVDGIIATCAGDAEGDKLMLQKLQKFRN